MSNQLVIPALRRFVRAPGVIAHYPCFQAVAEGTQLLDRSGAGNNAAFGAALLGSSAWASGTRLTIADNNAGTNAGGPFIAQSVLNFNLATESFLIGGYYNSASTATHYVVGFAGTAGAASSPNGFAIRSEVTTGAARLSACTGTAGAVVFGTVGTGLASNGADRHLLMAYDAVAKRLWLYVDGVNDPSNSGSGWDVSTQVAAMGVANGGVALGSLVFGGTPHTGSNQQVWACTSYGWQVAKRTGALPSNLDAVVKRLARHPLQVLTSTGWPA